MKRTTLFRLIPFVLGMLLIVAAALLYTHPWQTTATVEDPAWALTLVGRQQEQRILDMAQIKALPAETGRGGFFSTVGTISGPFEIKGVPLIDLCRLVGGITGDDALFVSAQDGYSTVLSYNQITGKLDTYDPATMRVVPHTKLDFVLMYELDGQPLTQDGGKPLRMAVISDGNLITEGFNWVRWVNRIEVIPLKTAAATSAAE
jgi:DMSO/TMAO reductase YedYZ molybdopterin-dependent catalytic subunit